MRADVCFLDEDGFAVSSRAKRGRSLIGSSAIVPVQAIRSRNISVIAACNSNEMLNFVINDRPVNG